MESPRKQKLSKAVIDKLIRSYQRTPDKTLKQLGAPFGLSPQRTSQYLTKCFFNKRNSKKHLVCPCN